MRMACCTARFMARLWLMRRSICPVMFSATSWASRSGFSISVISSFTFLPVFCSIASRNSFTAAPLRPMIMPGLAVKMVTIT